MSTPNPRCEKCGKVLVVSSNQFAVCPENIKSSGHSRLIAMSPELKQAIKVAELPRATLLRGIRATNDREFLGDLPGGDKTCGGGIYQIYGRPGIWRRVSKEVRKGELLVAATLTGQIWQFVRWHTMKEKLLGVLGRRQADEPTEKTP